MNDSQDSSGARTMRDERSFEDKPLPPLQPWQVAAFFTAGNALPSLGMLFILGGMINLPDWQSGKFHDHTALIFGGSNAALFCPLLIFAIACFTLALFRPQIANRYFIVRLGIYGGVMLALHYCMVIGILVLQVKEIQTSEGVFTVAVLIPFATLAVLTGCVAIFAFARSTATLAREFYESHAGVVCAMFVLPALGLAFGAVLHPGQASLIVALLILVPLFFVFVLTPCWFLAANVAMAMRLSRLRAARFQFRIWQLLAWMSWLGAYLAAWRYSVTSAVEAYAALPVDPPSGNCYIATAAAGGHRGIVQSREIRGHSGARFRVNMQLAYFKCGEIALQTTAPRVHAAVRGIYDRIGPCLARPLRRHRWAADFVYLTLKPLEWTTRLVLRMVVHDPGRIAREMYG